MSTIGVHISDILTYKRCRKLWEYSSPLRHNLEPIREYSPFFVGTAVHFALEKFYGKNIPLLDAARAYLNAYANKRENAHNFVDIDTGDDDMEDQTFLILKMLEYYDLWRQTHTGLFRDELWEFIPEYAELSFKAPLIRPDGTVHNRIHLEGRIDNAARYKPTGKVWLWEYKTCRSIKERHDMLPVDEQATTYLLAAKHVIPEPIEGIIYTFLRKKAPTAPKPLKNGFLSEAKNIDTTLEAFLYDAQNYYWKMHGEKLSKSAIFERHKELCLHLQGKGDTFVWRTPLKRTENELKRAADALWKVASEMVDDETYVYPHGGTHCSKCRFYQPCIAYRNNDETEEEKELLDAYYRNRNSYYSNETELDIIFDS